MRHLRYALSMITLAAACTTFNDKVAPGASLLDASLIDAKDDSSHVDAGLELLAVVTGPDYIDISADRVYFTSAGDGTVNSILKDGGTPLVLASSQPGARAIVVDEMAAYWLNNSGNDAGALMKCTLPACSGLQNLKSLADYPHGLALNATSVFYTVDNGAGSVGMASKGTGPSRILGASYAQQIAADADFMYWTVSGSGAVMKVRTDGTSASEELIGTQQAKPVGLAVDESPTGYVYFSDINRGSLERVNKSGGNPGLLIDGQSAPTALALAPDGLTLYWTELFAGTVRACPIGSCTAGVRLIASGQTRPSGIRVDATHVYWANQGDPSAGIRGAVLRALK
jgi:hypothetical protein